MSSPPRVGFYTGSDHDALATVAAASRWLDHAVDLYPLYTSWVDDGDTASYLFTDLLPAVVASERTPLLTWEPFIPPGDAPGDIARRVSTGEYDDYLRGWADSLATYLERTHPPDEPLYLRFAHEPNGDWYPWHPASPETYRRFWRHVHGVVTDRLSDATRVAWGWTVNHVDTGAHRFEALYPGDEYVDWVGVDGYNWGATRSWSTWSSPADVFEDALDRLRALTDRPCFVPEIGCTSVAADGPDPVRKGEWIQNAVAYLHDRDVRAICWFNQDKETDWAVFGGTRGTGSWYDDEAGTRYRVYTEFDAALSSVR